MNGMKLDKMEWNEMERKKMEKRKLVFKQSLIIDNGNYLVL